MNALTGLSRLRDRGNRNKFPRNWILLVGVGVAILVSAVSAHEEGETEQKVVLSKAEKDTLLARGGATDARRRIRRCGRHLHPGWLRLIQRMPLFTLSSATPISKIGTSRRPKRPSKRPKSWMQPVPMPMWGSGWSMWRALVGDSMLSLTPGALEARPSVRSGLILLMPRPTGFWANSTSASGRITRKPSTTMRSTSRWMPDNVDGLYYFGLACVQGEQYSKINTYLTPHLKPHLMETQLIPLIAQGYFFLERYETALEQFERYLQKVDDQERQHYTDISLVASEREFHAYQAISDSTERLDYLEKFWLRRDSDILTRNQRAHH